MEAIFKTTAAEFDLSLFKKIEELVKSNQQSEITISIKDDVVLDNTAYFNSLRASVKELQEGKSKTFSMEELEAYLKNNFSE
ncbi:hypothetical protein [uncultured Mucilaginibacter sp.]|uniref:hypothetical protein n=1 Tax=uncultured Mucilaginibacter sp. TaxID=797541 RepID=UPI002634B44A|nr:hypothetical protein [uncultured Mucilaginibacter sp.]